jgi:predicted Mrr-cat superfamily restriction endonuclease
MANITGQEERGFWPEFKSRNIIAIGWDSLGDLKKYSTDGDIVDALKRHYPNDYPRDKFPVNDVNALRVFSQSIKKGDVIVAKKGASKELYGIGKVTNAYHFDESRETFKHVIGVNWIIGFDAKVKVRMSKQFVQRTVGSLGPEALDEIKKSILTQFPNLAEGFGDL